MYKGEVNVEYCQLSALLKTAESLKVNLFDPFFESFVFKLQRNKRIFYWIYPNLVAFNLSAD